MTLHGDCWWIMIIDVCEARINHTVFLMVYSLYHPFMSIYGKFWDGLLVLYSHYHTLPTLGESHQPINRHDLSIHYIWLLVWSIWFFHILGKIIPTDEYFAEGLKPPTIYIYIHNYIRISVVGWMTMNNVLNEQLWGSSGPWEGQSALM